MDENQPIQTNEQKIVEEVARRNYEFDYVSIVLFLFILLGIGLIFSLLTTQRGLSPVVEEPGAGGIVEAEPFINPFDSISLDGVAAFVYDVKANEALFAKNEEMQLPLASITKLMTVLAASTYIEENETITIDYKSLDQEGDSGLFAFEEWKARDLFDFTLLVSSNDGASVLASVAGGTKVIRTGREGDTPASAFVDEMNSLAKQIGLSQTYFINETGLDPNEELSGGYGSARDTSKLLEYIILNEPRLVEATAYTSLDFKSNSNYEHTATNTNPIIGSIPGLIASKTGFTDLAGGNLVVAFDAGINRPVIISVLGSSKDGRFSDIEKLVEASLELLNK